MILIIERHWKISPEKLSKYRNFNTEKISSFSSYKTERGHTIIELFFTTGKWDILSSKDWDDKSFSSFVKKLTQECQRRQL